MDLLTAKYTIGSFLLHKDHDLTFEELVAKDGSFKIHERNFQRLLIGIFNVKMKLAPEIMKFLTL